MAITSTFDVDIEDSNYTENEWEDILDQNGTILNSVREVSSSLNGRTNYAGPVSSDDAAYLVATADGHNTNDIEVLVYGKLGRVNESPAIISEKPTTNEIANALGHEPEDGFHYNIEYGDLTAVDESVETSEDTFLMLDGEIQV